MRVIYPIEVEKTLATHPDVAEAGDRRGRSAVQASGWRPSWVLRLANLGNPKQHAPSGDTWPTTRYRGRHRRPDERHAALVGKILRTELHLGSAANAISADGTPRDR